MLNKRLSHFITFNLIIIRFITSCGLLSPRVIAIPDIPVSPSCHRSFDRVYLGAMPSYAREPQFTIQTPILDASEIAGTRLGVNKRITTT